MHLSLDDLVVDDIAGVVAETVLPVGTHAINLVVSDGIGTIVRMAAIYGTELGIGRGALIGSILIVQFVGVPFSFLFGALASRIGARRAIYLGLAVYAGISLLGFFMRTAVHFLVLAVLVGMVQGGTQALSRSLFAAMIPREKSGEFFGFFSVADKFAGIFGPAVFALVLAGLDTGSSFEGMGASREVTFASFAEPTLFLCFIALVRATGSLSLTGMLGGPLSEAWPAAAPSLLMKWAKEKAVPKRAARAAL